MNDNDVLLHILRNGEWDEKLRVVDVLATKASPGIDDALICLLEDDNQEVRDAAALALREIGNDLAVEPLFKAILDPRNTNARSTLVYALERLDCSAHFLDIFKLAISDKKDVQLSAMTILDEQGFYISETEIEEAMSILMSGNRKGVDCERLKLWLDSFLVHLKEGETEKAGG